MSSEVAKKETEIIENSVGKRSKYGILYKNGKNTPFRDGYKNALRVYSKAMEELMHD